MSKWFSPINKDGHITSSTLGDVSESQSGPLLNFSVVENFSSFVLSNVYRLKFKFEKEIVATLNEENMYECFFQNSEVFDILGKEVMICLDIALAKGGSEAVVESFYSDMGSQKMFGGQSNETIALRAKLDWDLPPVMQMGAGISAIADIYIEGDTSTSDKSKRRLKPHAAPVLGDRSKSYHQSKVIDRLETEAVRLSFLLHKNK